MQIDNTVNILNKLEETKHNSPIIIITKGDFSKFPDREFNLDLHFAFSTFGTDSYLDGGTWNKFYNNLKITKKRKYQYKYSIEFRPIIYNINDSHEILNKVIKTAQEFELSIGYSGLQGKPEMVKIWNEQKLNLQPYPGFKFGHKKIISSEVEKNINDLSCKYNVPMFKKTSCLISYVHNLKRDYNAHYYRPNEVGCKNCIMKQKCNNYYNNLPLINKSLDKIIPFRHIIINKQKHECILKKNNICEFPSSDCSNIKGNIIKIYNKITTADVRMIKWLTGYTVDANFVESPFLSNRWSV